MKKKISKEISISIIILLLVLIIGGSVAVYIYYSQGPSSMPTLLPASNRTTPAQGLLSIQGTVTSVGDQSLSISGFPLALQGAINIATYDVLIDENTIITTMTTNQEVPVEELASLKNIEVGDKLFVYSNSDIGQKKEFTAGAINILLMNFVTGQVKTIQGTSLVIKAAANVSGIVPQTYTILTDSQTRFTIKDYTQIDWQAEAGKQYDDLSDYPQPIETAGSFKDIKVEDNIAAYADGPILKGTKQFTATEIQIMIIPTGAVRF